MKEAFSTIRETFRHGLQRDPREVKSSKTLEVCRALRASEHGLMPHAEIIHLSQLDILPDPTWPFPQFLLGKAYALVCYGDVLYRVSNLDTWDYALITPKKADYTDIGSVPDGTIIAGGIWEVADLRDGWVATNGETMAINLPHLRGDGVPSTTVYTGSSAKANTVANVNGTLIFAGLSGDRFSSPAWARAWNIWKTHARREITSEDTELGQDYVFYSTYAGGSSDMPYALELSLLGYPSDGTFEKLESVYIDRVARGEMGFARMPQRGAVMHAKALGNDAVVYGENGVCLLRSVVDQGNTLAWGMTPLLDVGIAGRGHVAGNERYHVFVDNTGALWRITTEGSQKLGYREYFGPFVENQATAPVVGLYNPNEGEVLFSDGSRTFVLRGEALSERSDCPTSLAILDGETLGIVRGSQDAFEVVTTDQEFNQVSLKTVQVVEVGYSDITDLKVSVLFRYGPYGPDEPWRESVPIRVNQDGAAYPNVTANEVKIKLTGTRGENGKIDYVYIRWKLAGHRHIRGIYAQSD